MTHFIFIGLDVHKNSIDVAIAAGSRNAEVRHYGKIGGESTEVDRLVRKLGYKKKELRIVYEAGPC
ncbi:hypothetical protein SAMN02745124_01124 [Desulfofustis glycolicus DSM 9705]|uniref:Transposase n=1 Tax=Desulfofustis glycolicus DSM 9705 TaxID=1121409 RepID=A0A1M5UBJ0_9BACT|nr:hypothetical protein SAMN02745124_01124 [Desulfofustis glycolicus DSM 9705]